MNHALPDPARLGASLVVLGVLSLLTLRFWASPVVGTITGRDGVGVTAFLGIPLVLLLIGSGIALFIWGPAYLGDR